MKRVKSLFQKIDKNNGFFKGVGLTPKKIARMIARIKKGIREKRKGEGKRKRKNKNKKKHKAREENKVKSFPIQYWED